MGWPASRRANWSRARGLCGKNEELGVVACRSLVGASIGARHSNPRVADRHALLPGRTRQPPQRSGREASFLEQVVSVFSVLLHKGREPEVLIEPSSEREPPLPVAVPTQFQCGADMLTEP